MILLIDLGNSRLKWAFIIDGELQKSQAVDCEDLTPAKLSHKAWANIEALPKRVLVASVASAKLNKGILAWITRHWKIKAEFIKSQAVFGDVKNAYLESALLGVDRWLTLLAVRGMTRGGACIIDCGTAITVDVLSVQGEHLGGLIVPGLNAMNTCLIDKAEGIATMKESQGEISLLACDTYSAVQAGSLYAIVAFIDRVVSDLRAEIKSGFRVYITGGDAHKVRPLLGERSVFEEDLVLKGLVVIMTQNKVEK